MDAPSDAAAAATAAAADAAIHSLGETLGCCFDGIFSVKPEIGCIPNGVWLDQPWEAQVALWGQFIAIAVAILLVVALVAVVILQGYKAIRRALKHRATGQAKKEDAPVVDISLVPRRLPKREEAAEIIKSEPEPAPEPSPAPSTPKRRGRQPSRSRSPGRSARGRSTERTPVKRTPVKREDGSPEPNTPLRRSARKRVSVHKYDPSYSL